MATRLECFMDARGLNQAQLGEQIGVRGPSVSRYASGDRQPRKTVGQALSALSYGLIHAGNCADEISTFEAAEMMAEISRREAAAKAAPVAHD